MPSSASRARTHDETRVLVGEVKEGAVWLTATVSAPLDADVIQLGSDLREEVLDALGEAGALAREDPRDPGVDPRRLLAERQARRPHWGRHRSLR